ncbi:MAG TPA: GNAT family protein [Thermomicrobiaceae bacterium]|nr:GNAT family protein [Thermomicrobiaceae bacterium]
MSHLRAVYLTGEQVYIRALTKEDAKVAVAWFKSPFPINEAVAEEQLKELHGENQWIGSKRDYAIVRRADDQLIGGVTVKSWRGLQAELGFHTAPWLSADEADALRAEALALLVPWLRDEREAMAVQASIAADQPATLAAAESVGMKQTARLRRFIARPGTRVDLFLCEALNPHWEARNA